MKDCGSQPFVCVLCPGCWMVDLAVGDLFQGGMQFSLSPCGNPPWQKIFCLSLKLICFSVGMGCDGSVVPGLGTAPEGPSGFSHFLVFPVHLLDQQHAFWPCSPECC